MGTRSMILMLGLMHFHGKEASSAHSELRPMLELILQVQPAAAAGRRAECTLSCPAATYSLEPDKNPLISYAPPAKK